MKKKILIVAYNFPPSGSVGVLRTLRFLDELSEEEWEPHVLTVKKGTFLTLEPSMNEKIKESLEVHRTKSFEAFNTISSSAGFFQKFLKDIWFYFASPDIYVGWVPYAIKKGAEILKRQEFSVIYVSGKPFSSFLIGHYLSKKMGTPWVMDLRDLWTLNKRLLPKSPFHKYFEEYLERKFVHSASRVIVNTPDNKNDYLKSFTKEPKEKFMCITNGYDQGEFDEIRKDKFEKFTIGYCGNFYVNSTKRNRSLYSRVFNPKKKKSQLFETYSPQFIFESVEQIFREVPELKDKIEFRFVGSGCKKAAEFMTEYNLEKNVKLEGWVSYKKNLEIMSRSHVLFLVLSRSVESKGWIPSKLFQYLGTGNPVIAMVPHGDVEDIINTTKAGIVLEPDNVDGIKKAILAYFDHYYVQKKTFTPDETFLKKYEKKYLGELFTKCLNDALKTN